MRRGGCFDAEADAFRKRIDEVVQGKDAEHQALMRWFVERQKAEADKPIALLDADAVMLAYEARYGKEVAEAERKYLGVNWRESGRLSVLQQALESAKWQPAKHASAPLKPV
jgi:ABC-type xylose transport system substrate-binding protein